MAEYKTQLINGTLYAYIDTPYWNPVKKRGEHKREYIGKVVDGKLVPNKRYSLQLQLEEQQAALREGAAPFRLSYGATYLLDRISGKLGISADLRSCFGDAGDEILALAYYLVLEEGQPLRRFQKWARTHWMPCGKELSPQRIGEILHDFPKEQMLDYFRSQAGRRTESGYLAFETTGIQSFSSLIYQERHDERMIKSALVDLLVLYGRSSRLPVYCGDLPCDIRDAKTINDLMKDLGLPGDGKPCLVMESEIPGEREINDILGHRHKFLAEVPTSLALVRSHLEKDRKGFATSENYNPDLRMYVRSYAGSWDYTGERKGKRRVYIHIYLTEEALVKAENGPGFLTLMSNAVKDPVDAMRIYQLRNLTEIDFDNLDERLPMRRDPGAEEESLGSRIFVQFVALQIKSYINRQMETNALSDDYTMQSLLDELDAIEYSMQPGGICYLPPITGKQRELYGYMGIEIPS